MLHVDPAVPLGLYVSTHDLNLFFFTLRYRLLIKFLTQEARERCIIPVCVGTIRLITFTVGAGGKRYSFFSLPEDTFLSGRRRVLSYIGLFCLIVPCWVVSYVLE